MYSSRDFKEIENYNPDKTIYYSKDNKKDIKREIEKLKNLNINGKIDKNSIEVRNRKINENILEKKIIETLNSFSPEEITIKLGFAQGIGNDNQFKKGFFEEETLNYTNGITEKNTKGIFTEKQENEMQKLSKEKNISYDKVKEAYIDFAKRSKNTFETYEVLETHEEPENGFYALTVGNKKTGKVEIFFAATRDQEDRKAFMIEHHANLDSQKKTSINQEAALKYAREIQEKAKIGIKNPKNNKTYGPLDCVIGHSKGGGEAIYVASNLKNVRCLANDPAPVCNPGPYLNQNKILATIPNEGNGAFNYAEKIYGSQLTTLYQKESQKKGNGENVTNLIATLPIPRKKNQLSREKISRINMANHRPDAFGAGEALKKMQNYCKEISPILNNYLTSKNFKGKTDLANLVSNSAYTKKETKINNFIQK